MLPKILKVCQIWSHWSLTSSSFSLCFCLNLDRLLQNNSIPRVNWTYLREKKANSETRLGDFLTVLSDKFSSKSCQNDLQLFGQFWKLYSYLKTVCGNFWTTFYSNIWSHWKQNNNDDDDDIGFLIIIIC